MTDMKKVEGNAVPKKHKLDLSISINETFEQKIEVLDVKPESSKRQKLGTSVENETNITYSFPVQGKMAEIGYGEGHNVGGNKDDHLNVEAEIDGGKGILAEVIDGGEETLDAIIYRESRLPAAEKGKGILIEEPDETFEQNVQVLDVKPELSERQKFGTSVKNETNITSSFPIQGKMAEIGLGEGHNAGGNKGDHLNVEAEIDAGNGISAEVIDGGEEALDEII